MLKVGLTGNIGSGKTMISKVFRILGIPVFYADDIAKQIAESNKNVINLYKDWFGSDIYINGKLNRGKLANIIFNNDELLQLVNGLIHPLVLETFMNWIKNLESTPYVIFESAILYNTLFADVMDKIILITAPFELKIERVLKRDGRTVDEVKKILSKQPDEELIKKKADFIIINDEKDLIIPRIIEIHEKLQNKIYSVN